MSSCIDCETRVDGKGAKNRFSVQRSPEPAPGAGPRLSMNNVLEARDLKPYFKVSSRQTVRRFFTHLLSSFTSFHEDSFFDRIFARLQQHWQSTPNLQEHSLTGSNEGSESTQTRCKDMNEALYLLHDHT